MTNKKNVLLLAIKTHSVPVISKEYIDFSSVSFLKEMRKLIECDTITGATCWGSETLMGKNISMIGDDEALLIGRPLVNPFATLLGGYLDHGQPLFGNFIVVKHTEFGENADLSDEEMSLIISEINRLIDEIHNQKA